MGRGSGAGALGDGGVQGVRSVTFPGTRASRLAPLPWNYSHGASHAPVAQRTGRLATNQEGAGSTPARGARRSVAQRQSTGPTNRGAQVRVLPDRRWSWCSGSAFLTVTQEVPGRNRVATHGRAVHWRDKRPVKARLRPWEFESLPAHSYPRGAADSAPVSGIGGRPFESGRGCPGGMAESG
jgi:hypothetical protein